MMPAGLDAISAAVVAWLLTYAIHSTILLAGAAAVAWRFSDRHAMLDVIWKTALIVIMITAAVLSPTADIPNMLLFAAPMIILYVVSIFVAWIFNKPRTAS